MLILKQIKKNKEKIGNILIEQLKIEDIIGVDVVNLKQLCEHMNIIIRKEDCHEIIKILQNYYQKEYVSYKQLE